MKRTRQMNYEELTTQQRIGKYKKMQFIKRCTIVNYRHLINISRLVMAEYDVQIAFVMRTTVAKTRGILGKVKYNAEYSMARSHPQENLIPLFVG